MADIATWGQIAFDVLAMSGFGLNDPHQYARHSVVRGKPTLHNMGENNMEGTVRLKLYEALGDVQEAVDAIKAAKREGRSENLVWANGNVEGRFVIEDLKRRTIRTRTDGTLEFIELEIKFLEDPRDPQSSNARPQISRATATVRATSSITSVTASNARTLAASQATGAGIKAVADAVDAASEGFDVPTEEAADVVAGAAEGNPSLVQGLREALPLIGAVARPLGVDIRQSTAIALPLLEAAEGDNRQAGRDTASVIKNVASPSAGGAAEFARLNVRPDPQNTAMTIAMIGAAVSGLQSDEEQRASVGRMFENAEAATIVINAANDGGLAAGLASVSNPRVSSTITRAFRG